ncbi:MAG: DNA polymerase III subunit delta [Acidimicrobiia bacterium]
MTVGSGDPLPWRRGGGITVTAVFVVLGPKDAGPGERQEMLDRARRLLEETGADDVQRFDVPPAGGSEEGEGPLRAPIEGLIPALQSGSLFGGQRGVLVLDAHRLLEAEAAVVADLVQSLDPETVAVVFVSAGAVPASLQAAVKGVGEFVTVRKFRERDAAEWLGAASRQRRIRLEPDAAMALLQRFGSNVADLGRALDQLATVDGEITAGDVAARFRNRPDEPVWYYADALSAGDVGEALRRLAALLTHGHPLQVLAFLENDLRHRALASAAPDLETFAEWVGGSPEHYPIQKAWRQRHQASESELRKALEAVARADGALKGAPEPTHHVTMERLTVALARWYGGHARRAG